MSGYIQSTIEQPCQIYVLMNTKQSEANMGRVVGTHKSTDCCDLRRTPEFTSPSSSLGPSPSDEQTALV